MRRGRNRSCDLVVVELIFAICTHRKRVYMFKTAIEREHFVCTLCLLSVSSAAPRLTVAASGG